MTVEEEEQVDFMQNIDDDDVSSTSIESAKLEFDSGKLDTLGPMVSERGGTFCRQTSFIGRDSTRRQTARFEPSIGRLTKIDSVKRGVLMSPNGGSNRRSGLIMATLSSDLKQSRSLLDVSAVEEVGGDLQEQWMEVYQKNVMNQEPINPQQFPDFVWRRLLLMQDVKGYLLLHHACRRKCPVETIKWFIGDDDHDIITLSHRAQDGSLPIHIVCRSFSPFNIVKLVSKDSNGTNYINEPDDNGQLPLDLFGSGMSGGGSSRKSSNRGIVTSFTENMFEHLINDEETDEEEIFMAMDSICNNCPPKKFQAIVCNNLGNRITIEWLTWAFCQQKVIFSIMRDFYCKVIWTVLHMIATTRYLHGQRADYYAYFLYFFALIFLVREIRQVRRYVKAEVLVDYAKEIWNWVDCSVISLVVASATVLIIVDPNNNSYDNNTRRLLMVTNGFQLLHFASFLKKIFLPFATFVGGLMMVFKTLVPFLVCSAMILLVFAFSYHVDKFELHNPLPDDQLQFDTLWVSFVSVYHMFVIEPEEISSILDAFYGLLTSIVLLNVVIAVISIAWDRSTEEDEALKVFWEYRLTFIQDVTLKRKGNKNKKKRKGIHRLKTVSERFDRARSERIAQFHDPSTKNGIGLYFFFVFQYVAYFWLGLVTFGLFWPLRIRKDIFGIKFKPPREDLKAEIIETRKVHETVKNRLNELEGKLGEQTNDNVSLMEQNKSLHVKIDQLEAMIGQVTSLLLEQQQQQQQTPSGRASTSTIVQEHLSNSTGFTEDSDISIHRRVLPSGEVVLLQTVENGEVVLLPPTEQSSLVGDESSDDNFSEPQDTMRA